MMLAAITFSVGMFRSRNQSVANVKADLKVLNHKIVMTNESTVAWETVVLNETDQVVKDITWKVEIYDLMRQIKTDQFYTLTWRVSSGDTLGIIPGEQKKLLVTFYHFDRFVWQKDYRLNISIVKHTSSSYDPERDKPSVSPLWMAKPPGKTIRRKLRV